MLERVKQVMAALTAEITAADEAFISKFLIPEEARLFWGMNLPDQRHALNVAYTALELAKAKQSVNTDLLVRCALFHDVGKVKGDVSTADKIITVLAHTIAPHWSRRWGRMGKGSKVQNLRHAFYIYFHHAARSAAMLEKLGLYREAAIVAKHHETPAEDDPPELRILRIADDLN